MVTLLVQVIPIYNLSIIVTDPVNQPEKIPLQNPHHCTHSSLPIATVPLLSWFIAGYKIQPSQPNIRLRNQGIIVKFPITQYDRI